MPAFESAHPFRRYWRVFLSRIERILEAFDFSRRRFEIVSAALSRSAPRFHLHSDVLGLVDVDAAADRRTAATLMARETAQTSMLDVRKTVAATLRNAGLFTPRTASRSFPVHYLILAQRRSAADMEFVRSCRMVAHLRASGVQLTFFAYSDAPTRVSQVLRGDGSLGSPSSLTEIYQLFPSSRLILLSDGSELLEPFRYLPYRWARTLENWPFRALLTPVGRRDWEQRELALTQDLGFSLATTRNGIHEALRDAFAREHSSTASHAIPKQRVYPAPEFVTHSDFQPSIDPRTGQRGPGGDSVPASDVSRSRRLRLASALLSLSAG